MQYSFSDNYSLVQNGACVTAQLYSTLTCLIDGQSKGPRTSAFFNATPTIGGIE